jgi:amidase
MLRRLGVDELQALAAEARFDLSPSEEAEYVALADAILGTLDALEKEQVLAPAPVEADRDAGRPPDPGEDPLNAVVRRCRVKARGAGGVLGGKRVALKDAIAIACVPMTCGSRTLEGFVPRLDAVVTERILLAGGEIVAVTNMDDLAFSGGGDSSWYGPTLNPYDPARTAGGSSGGSAAALHYDGVDVALGCDQGGSIRVPAAWCGVLGLKPTHGLVPYTGIAGIDQTFDHVGPLAASVADTAALLQAIAGKHDSDPRQRDVPDRDYLQAVADAPDSLDGVTIGIVQEGFSKTVGARPEVVDAVEAATLRLRDLGAATRRLSLPEHVQAGGIAFAGFVEGMTDLMTSGGNGYAWQGRYWPEFAEALGRGLRTHAQHLSAQVKITLLLGAHLRSEHFGALYAKAQNLRPWLRQAYDRALEGVDALLLPSTPGLPHEVDAALPLSERVLRGWAVLANTYPTDMTGHPALTMPAAESAGLPVGVMLVGRRFADDRLLTLAATYERRYGWLPERSKAPAERRAGPSEATLDA